MKKYGYDFKRPASLGHVFEAKASGINEIQKKIQEQQGVMALPKASLSYVPLQLVRISGWHKDKQSIV